MSGCPSIHDHPEFTASFDINNKRQDYEVKKVKKFLKANPLSTGETLKYELSPFKSFPRGHQNTRVVFILCRDCKKEVLKPKCTFCESSEHNMNDAVLFYISSHDRAYSQGQETIIKYKTLQ